MDYTVTTFECKACHVQRSVTVIDDMYPPPSPDPIAEREAREARAREILRHARCPACRVREPEAVAAYRRFVWRWRGLIAFFALLAVATAFVPWLGLIPAIYGVLNWVLSLRKRIERRRVSMTVASGAVAAGSVVWVLAMPRYAFVLPALYAATILLMRVRFRDPFALASKRCKFADRVYSA